jgi:hypothetical protein
MSGIAPLPNAVTVTKLQLNFRQASSALVGGLRSMPEYCYINDSYLRISYGF